MSLAGNSTGRGRTARRWALGLGVPAALAVAFIAWNAAAFEGRSPADEAAALRGLLRLAPGMTVAEIGAGDGQVAIEVGRMVSPGAVYANELDPALVEVIRRRSASPGGPRVTAVRGAEEATNLPPACCDVIFMRRVYHDLTNPAPVLADVRHALQPGGRFVVIDFEPTLVGNLLMPRRTNRGGHGIARDDLLREVRAAGFSPLDGPRDWDRGLFVAVFR